MELSDGQDLAAALAQIDTPDARGEWLANLLVDAGCAAPAEAVETNGGPPPLAAGGRYAGRVLNVAELLARPEEPIPWRCEGIAADGYLTVLAGRGGEGKSWMALALACGVARGKPAAGIPCAAGRSLIFDAENGPPLIARRLRAAQVGPDLALQPVDVGGLRFTDDLDWMRGEIEGQGADLVIFDSLRVLSSGAKGSDADEMREIEAGETLEPGRVRRRRRSQGAHRGSGAARTRRHRRPRVSPTCSSVAHTKPGNRGRRRLESWRRGHRADWAPTGTNASDEAIQQAGAPGPMSPISLHNRAQG